MLHYKKEGYEEINRCIQEWLIENYYGLLKNVDVPADAYAIISKWERVFCSIDDGPSLILNPYRGLELKLKPDLRLHIGKRLAESFRWYKGIKMHWEIMGKDKLKLERKKSSPAKPGGDL